MKNFKLLSRSVFAALIAMTLSTTAARADLIFDISQKKNGNLSDLYGTVTLSQTVAGTVHLYLELAPTLNFKGGDLVFAFNVNLSSIGIANIDPSSGFSWVNTSNVGPPVTYNVASDGSLININGNVSFGYGIGCTDILLCGAGGSDPQFPGPLEFDIIAVGLDLSSFINTFDASYAYYFGLDNQTGGARFAGSYCDTTGNDPCVPGQNSIPEPATLAIFGAGFFGYGLIRRRRRRQIA